MARLSRLSPRKQVKLRCACYERIVRLIGDTDAKRILTLVELFADGKATRRQLRRARSAQFRAMNSPPNTLKHALAMCAHWVLADEGLECQFGDFEATVHLSESVSTALEIAIKRNRQFEKNLHQELLEDVQLPERISLDPRWLTSTVLDLTQTIHDDRVFERMPILGDALMDAGCDSEEIIQHCQGTGPHVRGCWVVDLLTGKE